MSGALDNIHPELDQSSTINILLKDVNDVDSESDYYMAVSHLVNFPDSVSIQALMSFLEYSSPARSVLLAQRKAVEVLARLDAVEAEPAIASCLRSLDIYMIENAAWALAELNCQESSVHSLMTELVQDTSQNQRVLIQSLAKLNVTLAIPAIKNLLKSDQPSVRGAAIAAMVRLTGERSNLQDLGEHLFDPNQMVRQCAVQDIIDSDASELLTDLLQAPISPSFRLRAIQSFINQKKNSELNQPYIAAIDQVLRDDPRKITVLHSFSEIIPVEILLQNLFHPDFSRCYLAMNSLLQCSPDEVWHYVEEIWNSKIHNDYGAHYFLIQLFGLMNGWNLKDKNLIRPLLLEAVFDLRPQFKKSPPAALLSLSRLFPGECDQIFQIWLLPSQTSSWIYRYSALLAIESDHSLAGYSDQIRELSLSDPAILVRCKAQSIYDTL